MQGTPPTSPGSTNGQMALTLQPINQTTNHLEENFYLQFLVNNSSKYGVVEATLQKLRSERKSGDNLILSVSKMVL